MNDSETPTAASVARSRPVSRRRLRIVVAAVSIPVAVLGAGIWSRAVGTDDDDVIRLDGPGSFADAELANPDRVGESLPQVTVMSADGRDVALRSDGRPMVVNVWTTTCGPCSRELRYFGSVERELAGSVRFVGVDPLDDGARMVEFAEARGVDYELYVDERFELFDALEMVSFPLTLFVDRDGVIVAQTGELSERELRASIAELVAA